METGLVILISLFFSAFFSGIEIAYITANRLELELKRKKGMLSAKLLSYLTRHPSRFIGALLIGNNVSLVFYGIYMAKLLEPPLRDYLATDGAVMVAQTILSTLLVLFTAEFLPKVLFRINPNAILSTFAIPLWIIYHLMFVLVWVIIGMAEFILKHIFGIAITDQHPVFGKTDLDHYLHLATTGPNTGENMDPEIQIFKNALDFTNVKVRECMVPRTEIVALPIDSALDELKHQFIRTGLSKILIYKDSIDHIIGYTHSYELFKSPKHIKSILLPIIIAPETMRANELMEKFIREHKSVAVVVDEFGGTAGMVTMEDIMEEIFGEIEDEHDSEELVERKIGDHDYLFSARHEIDYLNDTYQLGLKTSEEYETLGGMITYYHQSIPRLGEEIVVDRLQFTIKKASDSRIDLIRLKVLE
ncbi:MAG: HlyC/CorC family transporter [Flavobacteriales bacterium]|nr:HlyC/CorC family transporter [Flavobacteriales bacterium]MCB9449164.1 HlyC/CorC family transporter [Flavobacteriales bacterium]